MLNGGAAQNLRWCEEIISKNYESYDQERCINTGLSKRTVKSENQIRKLVRKALVIILK